MALRLCPASETDDEHRLVFPRAALDQAWGRRAAPPPGGDTARDVLATLDALQTGIDRLRDEVEHYKFPAVPAPEGPRPRAA